MEGNTERLTLSVREAAKIVGVSHVTLFREIHEGRFPAIFIGKRRVVVPKAALEKYLANAGCGA